MGKYHTRSFVKSRRDHQRVQCGQCSFCGECYRETSLYRLWGLDFYRFDPDVVGELRMHTPMTSFLCACVIPSRLTVTNHDYLVQPRSEKVYTGRLKIPLHRNVVAKWMLHRYRVRKRMQNWYRERLYKKMKRMRMPIIQQFPSDILHIISEYVFL